MEVLENMPLDSGRNVTLSHLQEAHPSFWKTWSEEVLQLGPSDDTLTVDMTLRFLEEMAPMMAAIDTTSGEEGQLAQQSEQLQEALKRHLVLFPEAELPDVVWMPSGFNFALYPTPEWVGIGLDWFMEQTIRSTKNCLPIGFRATVSKGCAAHGWPPMPCVDGCWSSTRTASQARHAPSTCCCFGGKSWNSLPFASHTPRLHNS